MQFFRNFFKSKFGIPVTLAFVVLIGFAFATSDVANNSMFGGIAGGERVAIVGDKKINSSDLVDGANNAVRRLREDDPTLSMPAFIAQGGLTSVLDQLIERASLARFAEKFGLRAGENLINSEILKIPGTLGSDGKFNRETYLATLSNMGISDAKLREELNDVLLLRQLLIPAQNGAVIPGSMASRYASLLKETRVGTIALLPSAAFAPKDDPSDSVIQAYYDANKGDYVRPERRVIRYATFGADILGERGEPTDAEIANYYEENRKQFAETERRTITQFIVPTRQAAQSFRDRIGSGNSIEQAARAAGLSTAKVENVTEEEFAAQTSQDVAKAVFAAQRGTVAEPARSGLGFHVARVDSIDRQAGQSLAQARGEITQILRVRKRRDAVTDLAADLEGQITDGASISDIAKEVGASLKVTEPITATGLVYGKGEERAPEVLLPAVKTAFDMEEGEPQLVEIKAGETFLIFEVSDITPSAAAPLKDIKPRVAADWKISEGSKKAKAASERILARVRKGSSLTAAMREEKTPLPGVEAVNLSREQLAQMGQQVPPPLALLFSMAQGTAKRLEAPRNGGWYILDLEKIETREIKSDDPLLPQVRQELGRTTGAEYSEQLRNAIMQQAGVEKNETAIEAVRKRLLGEQ